MLNPLSNALYVEKNISLNNFGPVVVSIWYPYTQWIIFGPITFHNLNHDHHGVSDLNTSVLIMVHHFILGILFYDKRTVQLKIIPPEQTKNNTTRANFFLRKVEIKTIREQEVPKKCIIIIPSHHQISIEHISKTNDDTNFGITMEVPRMMLCAFIK